MLILFLYFDRVEVTDLQIRELFQFYNPGTQLNRRRLVETSISNQFIYKVYYAGIDLIQYIFFFQFSVINEKKLVQQELKRLKTIQSILGFTSNVLVMLNCTDLTCKSNTPVSNFIIINCLNNWY
ncbi:unnamed protein product [Paramecium sonneborni]|uniref:Uncharacterized protein n=1 Tax=Paramecium sonneborni TaxID=65129 RepID=A0A8S1RFY0_9CILI|nr:unnamed protein product [Paramecium sonneborni]